MLIWGINVFFLLPGYFIIQINVLNRIIDQSTLKMVCFATEQNEDYLSRL